MRKEKMIYSNFLLFSLNFSYNHKYVKLFIYKKIIWLNFFFKRKILIIFF